MPRSRQRSPQESAPLIETVPGTGDELAPVPSAASTTAETSASRRAALLQVRERIDEMLAYTSPSAPAVEPTWMRISQFARTHHYSAKTVSQWCRLGMPHIGSGHHCRIDVRAAQKWIAEDGPRNAAMRLGMLAHTREAG